MRVLLIGSTAMAQYLPYGRPPKDIDFFADHNPDADFASKVEIFWHDSFREWLPQGTDRVATLDELYTIKVSHSYWDLKNSSWEKHIEDAMALKAVGALLLPRLHDLLYKVWEEKHGAKKVNLSEEADDFFADAVKRVYDHDSIHYSVAYTPGKPLYEEAIKEGRTVAMDMTKVWSWPKAKQLALFREEVYATALERWMIPNDYRFSARRAYALALRKTITSLTKGRSARFLVENYDTFRRPDMDYVQHHKDNAKFLIPLEA